MQSTDFDEISSSITQQQKQIQENQVQRNRIFTHCLDTYLNHLKEETQQLDSTELQNQKRNQLISSAFENVYERIMMSSQTALRKVKETCYQKREFWDKLIQNNAAMSDLEMKKQFYAYKRECEDRYYQAIDNQKYKKKPYHLLLGKLKQKTQLKQWQANNKKLQGQVAKGTQSLNNWRNRDAVKGNQIYGYNEGTTANDSNYFINQFTTGSGPWNRPPLQLTKYDGGDGQDVLKGFEYRKGEYGKGE